MGKFCEGEPEQAAKMNGVKKGTLILITNHFPFGKFESFLEPEIGYLLGSFSRVIVLTRDITSVDQRCRDKTFDCFRISPTSNVWETMITAGRCLWHIRKVVSCLWEEVAYLRRQKTRISARVAKTMLHDLLKAVSISYHLQKIIRTQSVTGNLTLYSYWLTSAALATTFVTHRGQVKKVSRVHRGDLYAEKHPVQYLSFRYTLARHLDCIYSISQNGCNYLQERLPPAMHSKIVLGRLGTFPLEAAPKLPKDTFTLLSCSFLRPVKRVHLIIESLAALQDLKIDWYHIGDGPLMRELKELANSKLKAGNGIRCYWMGALSHAAVAEFYRNHSIDLFINTSSSEGIPVTMMEAQSCGIPILATDVGGVSEIVSSTCGWLIPAHSTPVEIARRIREILSLPKDDYLLLRRGAVESWQALSRAEKNFSTFVNQIAAFPP